MFEGILTVTTVGLLFLGIVQYKFYKKNRENDMIAKQMETLKEEHNEQRIDNATMKADIAYTKQSVDKIENHIETIYTAINALKDLIIKQGD